MNRGEMVEAARRRLGAPDATYFTTEDIEAWLEEGQEQFADDTHCIQRTATITTVASQREYELPDDFLQSKSAWRGSSSPVQLDPLQGEEDVVGYLDQSGTPVHYYVRGDYLGLHPEPSDGTTTIRIYYYAAPDAFVDDSSVSEIPKRYHRAVVSYACAIASQMDEEDQRYLIFSAEYNRFKAKCKARMANRVGDYIVRKAPIMRSDIIGNAEMLRAAQVPEVSL